MINPLTKAEDEPAKMEVRRSKSKLANLPRVIFSEENINRLQNELDPPKKTHQKTVSLSNLVEKMSYAGEFKDVFYRYKQLSHSKVTNLEKRKSELDFDRLILVHFRKHQS